MEEVLLRGTFQKYPECSRFYTVAVSRQNVIIEEKQSGNTFERKPNSFATIALKDMLVAKVFTSKIENDASGYFQLIYFPCVKAKRTREVVVLRVAESDSREENVNIAETWSRTISWLLADPSLPAEDLQSKEEYPPRRRFLILLNPKSGSGKSVQVYKRIVEPIFEEEGSEYEVITTDHSGHGNKIGKGLDIKKWTAAVICSGDGLVHEFFNGLMERTDWESACIFPIAIIPTGSGNAVSAAIFHAIRESFSLRTAAFMALRGKPKVIDCCSITMEKRRMFSLLSTTWGLISDIDIESERFRLLGQARFTVGALTSILSMRIYEGKLSFLPADPSHPFQSLELDPAELVNQLLPASEQEFDADYTSNTRPNRGTSMVVSSSKPAKSKGSPNATKNGKKSRAASSPPIPRKEESKSAASSSSTMAGPVDVALPPLSDALPDSWTTVEGQFVTVCALLVSHIGEGMMTAPEAGLCDGLIHLFYVRKGASRKSVLSMFTSMEKGEHVTNPDMKMAVVKAFRLEPSMARVGYMAVDGELVEYNSIQGEMHAGLARIVSI